MILGLMLWNRNVFYGSCADNKCGMELTCDAFNRMLCRLMVWLNFHYDWKCHYGRSAWTIANRECFDRWNCKFPNQSHITVETYREPTMKHNSVILFDRIRKTKTIIFEWCEWRRKTKDILLVALHPNVYLCGSITIISGRVIRSVSKSDDFIQRIGCFAISWTFQV